MVDINSVWSSESLNLFKNKNKNYFIIQGLEVRVQF